MLVDADTEATRTTLEVLARRFLTEDIVELTLARPDRTNLPRWRAGAHIDLQLPGELTRQYSLCGDPGAQSEYRIAVLKEPDGRGGSRWVHEHLGTGSAVTIGGPRNTFEWNESGENYVFVAGGVGITPLVSMVAKAQTSGKPWHLVYGGRSHSSMAYADHLVDTYGPAVTLWPEDEHGLIDLQLALGPAAEAKQIYCCGPEPLLVAVEDYCSDGWPVGAVHLERFAARARQEHDADQAVDVICGRSDITCHVLPGQSIATVLRQAGVTVPVSCKEGVCGSCETAVLVGTPDHRDSVLEDWERSTVDTIFPCVSWAHGPSITLDL